MPRNQKPSRRHVVVAPATSANVDADDFRKLWQDRDLDLRILKEPGYAKLNGLLRIVPAPKETEYLQALMAHPFKIGTTVEVRQGQKFADLLKFIFKGSPMLRFAGALLTVFLATTVPQAMAQEGKPLPHSD